MNGKTAAAGMTSAVAPGALIVGTALMVQTVIGLQASRDRYRAEAARPRPTATVTSRPAPASGTSTAPAPDVSRMPTSAPERTPAARVIAAPRSRPGRDPSGSSPSPSPSPAPSAPDNPCRGALVAVRLPLALPRCAVVAGGTG